MLGNKKKLKNVCRFFAISFLINVFSSPMIESKSRSYKQNKNFHNQKTIKKSKINSKISELKNEKNKILNKINEVQHKINSEIKTQKNIQDEIAQVQFEVGQLNIFVYECNEQLQRQEEKISELEELKSQKEVQIKDKKKKLGEYIRALYTSDDLDLFRILFGSRNLDDFVDKAQLLKIVMSRITSLFDEIIEDLKVIKNSINEIQDEKIKYEENLKQCTIKQIELKSKVDDLNKLYDRSKESQESLKCELDEDNKELRDLDSQINEYYESLQKQQPSERSYIPKYDGTLPRLLWPVKGFTRITSNFKDRESRRSSHGAIDIGRNYGEPIIGKPVRAPIDMIITSAGPCGGYGNLVTGMFEHCGHKYCFYFGHLSKIAASRGVTVKRGTVIGFVGNTGFSTGPHLHFEIRRNGTRIDPMSFPFDY